MAERATAKIVDFTNVKDGGQFNKRRIPEGDYLGYVARVQDTESKADGEFMYLFTIKLKKYADVAFPYYCKLSENQLWKLRNLFQSAGIPIAKKKIKVDPTRLLNRPLAIAISDDEYEGKAQSTISAIFSAAELDVSAGASKVADEDDENEVDTNYVDDSDDEEEEVDAADHFEEMDRGALKAYIKEHEADFRFLKSQSDDDLRTKARMIEAAANTVDLDDEDDDEEEEEVVAPVATKRRVRKAKPVADEMEELDIEDL